MGWSEKVLTTLNMRWKMKLKSRKERKDTTS